MIKTALSVLQFSSTDVQEFLNNALMQTMQYTESEMGYIYFRRPPEDFSILCSSCDKILKIKPVKPLQNYLEIQKTLLWRQFIQNRKVFINNALAADDGLNKVLAQQPGTLKKIAAIPVFEKENLVLVLVLANAKTGYLSETAEQLTLLMEAAWDKQKNLESLSREEKLETVLTGIRSVNQLIVKESDPAKLIRQSCEKIVRSFGYLNAWILLLDEQGNYTDFAYAGDIDYGAKLQIQLENKQIPSCVGQVVKSENLVLFDQEGSVCTLCSMATDTENSAAMGFALRSEGKLLGMMTAWVPVAYISRPREQELFIELANDIAFALYKIKTEAERKQLSQKLSERIKEMKCTLAVSHEIQKDHSEAVLFKSLVDSIKLGFMYPDELVVKIEVDCKIYGDELPNSNKVSLLAALTEADRQIGQLEVAYAQELEFILPEEQKLLDNIAMMVSRWIEKKRTIGRLIQSEENLSITLQSIGDGVLATDSSGRVRRMNKVAESLTGFKLEEVWNKPVSEVFNIVNASSRETVTNPLEKILKTGKKVGLSNHTVLISANGKEYHISDSAAPIRNKKNEIEGMILVFSDVTAQYKQQASIAESERKFKAFFNAVPGAVSITEITTGKYIDVNGAFESMSEYQHSELIGKTSLEINIWANSNDRKEFVKKLIKEKQVTNYETNFRTKSGRILHGLMTGVITEIDGKEYIMLIVADISELFYTRMNLLKSNTALSQLPTGVIITDLDFNIEYVNPIVSVLTAYKSDQLIGKQLKMLIAHDYFERCRHEIKQQLLAGKLWVDEFQNKRSDGSLFWVNASISGVYNDKGELMNFTVVEQDITKDKALHDQLVRAKEKAEASDELKTAFMNNISHEIRTPLNSILGFGELLLNISDYSNKDRQHFLSLLNKSSRRLTDTITDYMDISLISSGNMEVRKKAVKLNDLLQEVYDYMVSEHEPEELEFKLTMPQGVSVVVDSDAELLKKILLHLTHNAFKFTTKGSIEIGFEQEDEAVRIFVKDTGIGIDESKQQEVFGFFQQENTTLTRGHEGSGLGLSIVKGLADLLGFSIQLHSKKHQGTKITLILPFQKQLATSIIKETETMENPVLEKVCILIAEDEDTNFFVLDLFLRKTFSAETIRAFNGLEAVKACQENPNISLVLMDIKMPVMDGIEATKQIKVFRPDLPIIAITAYALSGDEQKLLAAGCDDYIAKPVRKETLINKVSQYIKVY
ncbi:MAG: PAS domain S-box protein [Bacteroidales bacterium]|nr:PAS domain S-box protein [Bacteroidales bacterium]